MRWALCQCIHFFALSNLNFLYFLFFCGLVQIYTYICILLKVKQHNMATIMNNNQVLPSKERIIFSSLRSLSFLSLSMSRRIIYYCFQNLNFPSVRRYQLCTNQVSSFQNFIDRSQLALHFIFDLIRYVQYSIFIFRYLQQH